MAFSTSSISSSSSLAESTSSQTESTSSSSNSSSRSSNSSSTLAESTSSQTESTSSSSSTSSLSSSSSESSISSSSSSEIKATEIAFSFRGTTWSSSKYLTSALPAINGSWAFNSLCQTVKIGLLKYSIQYIACYLKRIGNKTDYDVVLEIRQADDNGKPTIVLDSSLITATNVNKEGWYTFEFTNSLDQNTPSNQFLSFVIRQIGGDDQNHIDWYYFLTNSVTKNKAFMSHDGEAEWVEQPDITRLIKTSDAFDIFNDAYIDSLNHRIQLLEGKDGVLKSTGEEYLSQGDFNDTFLTKHENLDCVSILHQPLVVSILIDCSGSMGWNDRYFERKEAVNQIINQLIQKYPNDVYFDISKFGSIRINALNFNSSDTYATIKIDLNTPDRIKFNNDGTTPSMSDSFIAWGFSNLEDGHEYVIDSLWASPSKTYLEDGIGSLDADLGIYKPLNYQSIGNQNRTITYYISDNRGVGSEKGNGKSAIISKIISAESTTLRKAICPSRELGVALLLKDINSGQSEAIIDNPEIFNINSLVDAMDANYLASGLRILSLEDVGNNQYKITFDQTLTTQIVNSFSLNGGFIQEKSSVLLNFNTNDTMVEILLKDPETTRLVTFYLQSEKGGVMEWDIEPFKEWQSFLYFYADNYGDLVMEASDSDGQPLKNGTRIDLYVDDERVPGSKGDEKGSVFMELKEPVKISENQFIIYSNDPNTISVFDKIEKDDVVVLSDGLSRDGESVEDSDGLKEYTVYDILKTSIPDEDDITKSIDVQTIVFTPAHTESWIAPEFLVMSSDELPLESLLLNVPISAVNITPKIQNKELPPELLLPSDPVQIKPSDDISLINQEPIYKVDNTLNIPSINGKANVRVLPITEDVIQTIKDQNSNTDALYGQTSLTYEEMVEQDQLQQEYLSLVDQDPNLSVPIEESSSSSDMPPLNDEYSIERPVYTDGGKANSHMQSKATSATLLSEYAIDGLPAPTGQPNPIKYIGLNYPVKLPQNPTLSEENNYLKSLLAAKHLVHPYITTITKKRVVRQKIPDIPIYFADPIQIYSQITSYTKTFYAMGWDDRGPYRIDNDFPIIYASENNIATINYVVYNKGILLKNGILNIKVFDETRTEIDLLNINSSKSPDLDLEAANYMKDLQRPPGEETPPFSSQYQVFRSDPNTLYINSGPIDASSQKFVPISRMATEATYLPGYSPGGVVLNIRNGRASFTIRSNEKIKFMSYLRIVAEVVSPENELRSTIRDDGIFLSNPLEITPIIDGEPAPFRTDVSYYYWVFGQPFVYFGESGGKKNNIGAQITWMGQNIIPDNTALIISSSIHDKNTSALTEDIDGESDEESSSSEKIKPTWPATSIYPSASKTINGVAQDSYIGEHGQVINHEVTMKFGGEPITLTCGDTENLQFKSSWNGMSAETHMNIMWMGVNEEVEPEGKIAYLSTILYKNGKLNNGTDLFADGWDYIIAVLDLPTSYLVGYEFLDEIKPLILGDVKTTEGTSQPLTASFNLLKGQSAKHNSKGIWSKNIPIDPITNKPLELIVQNYSQNNAGWATSSPISQSFIPLPPPDGEGGSDRDCQPCKGDPCTKLQASFSAIGDMAYFLKTGKSKQTYQIRGCGGPNTCLCHKMDGSIDTSDWVKPLIFWKDPLYGEMHTIPDAAPYNYDEVAMDGERRTLIIADITFSGLAIPLIAKKNNVVPKFKKTEEKTLTWQEQVYKLMKPTADPTTNILNSFQAANIEETARLNEEWDYYIDILKKNKMEQQSITNAQNNPLIFKKKDSVNWISYFPNVVFDIYLQDIKQAEDEDGEVIFIKSNLRRVRSLSLSSYNVILSINQTSDNIASFNDSSSSSLSSTSSADNSYSSEGLITHGHYHTCKVNDVGIGKTIETYESKTLNKINNHEHLIEGFVVGDAYDEELHYHDLKSTAMTWINAFKLGDLGPVSGDTKIIINASLQYDASKTFVERSLFFTKEIQLFADKSLIWNLDLYVPKVAFTSLSTTNKYVGFDVNALLYQGPREDQDGAGWIMPSIVKPPDGTRIKINFASYAPKKYLQNEDSTDIVVSDNGREYILVSTTATAKIPINLPKNGADEVLEEQEVSVTKVTKIFTKIPWIPDVKSLTGGDLTNEPFYLEKATEKIECVGSSQMYDGILHSLSRLKSFYLKNPDLQNAIFMVLLFTDGEENYSENGFSYLLSNIKQSKKFAIYPIPVGDFVTSLGNNLLNIVSKHSSGEIINVKNHDGDEIFSYVKSVLQNQKSNYGTFTNTIELNNAKTLQNIISQLIIPDGSKTSMAIRAGNYLNNMSAWSDEIRIIDPSQTIDLYTTLGDDKYKYLQYKLKLTGSEDFESPLYFGNSLTYIEPLSTMLFFQPINIQTRDDEFLSELIITHKISGEQNVEIQYGFTYSNSTKESDYYNEFSSPIKAGARYIILSRINEATYTENNFLFSMVNGPWPDICSIEVYRTTNNKASISLVNASEYTAMPKKGQISFNKSLSGDDIIFASLKLPSSFRLLCKINNSTNNPSYLDHVGIMYNIAQKPNIGTLF